MNFKSFNKLSEFLVESTKVESTLHDNLRPKLAEETLKLLNNYSHSPLARYIIQRIHNPETTKTQELMIDHIDTLDSYIKDKILYDQLMNIKAGDVGPGEILIGLTVGNWVGGNTGKHDVNLPNIGDTEVKYIGEFERSANVSMGSSQQKRLIDTDIPEIFNSMAQIIRESPQVIKRYLTPEEIEYFIDNTMDQLEDIDGSDMSRNSIRLVARMLKQAEDKGDRTFNNKQINFKRLTDSMEKTLKDSMGDSEYIMFIGDKIKSDGIGKGQTVGGKYYIMPKDKIKYWHFYRIYRGDRIKIAPFTTERDFMDVRIHNK